MQSAAHQIELSSGRSVAWAEYGAPDGEPVFFFHGWPSSRTQGALAHDAAAEAGMRLISLDRPGIGLSTLHPGRHLIDWPPLLGEVADHLELQRFRILSVSGGGPYAIASGWGLPERVRAATVVCGAPPIADTVDGAGLVLVYRWLLALHRRQPSLVRQLFRIARPFARYPAPLWSRPWLLKLLTKPDAAVLQDPIIFDICYRNFCEAWEGSAEGVITDAEIYAQPWGFPVEEVRVPVRIWHGKQDRNFSWELSQALAARLPNCEARFLEAEGHYSLPIRRVREILEDLRTAGAD